jgi:hypothetical protein
MKNVNIACLVLLLAAIGVAEGQTSSPSNAAGAFVLQIRLCGMTYGQLSASNSIPSAMTAGDTGVLRQQQNRIMKLMILQPSFVLARSPLPLL